MQGMDLGETRYPGTSREVLAEERGAGREPRRLLCVRSEVMFDW